MVSYEKTHSNINLFIEYIANENREKRFHLRNKTRNKVKKKVYALYSQEACAEMRLHIITKMM